VGNTCERFIQTYNGVPIYATEMVVTTLRTTGEVKVKDNFVSVLNIADDGSSSSSSSSSSSRSSTVPTLTKDQAVEIAKAHVVSKYGGGRSPELYEISQRGDVQLYIVSNPEQNKTMDYLTYVVSLELYIGTETASDTNVNTRPGHSMVQMPLVFVDAHGGRVVLDYDNLQTAAI